MITPLYSEEIVEKDPRYEILQIATHCALSTGYLIRGNADLAGTPKGPEFKAKVDVIANEAIVNPIRDAYPDDSIFSEESRYNGNSEWKWIIDPTDGTVQYLNGSPYYSILISCADSTGPQVSVCYLPATQRLFYTIAGHGAFLMDFDGKKKLTAPEKLYPLSAANIALDPGYDPRGREKVSNLITQIGSKVGAIQMNFSNGYTLAQLANGELKAYIHCASKSWEIAGLHIFAESGGTITDRYGNPINFDLTSEKAFEFVASKGIDHQELLNLLN